MKKYCSTRQATDDNTVLGVACWIPKSTDTCSEYVLLIDLSLQQRMHKRALMLCFMHVVCLVVTCIQLFYVNSVWKGYVCVLGILVSTVTDHILVVIWKILNKLTVIRLRCLC